MRDTNNVGYKIRILQNHLHNRMEYRKKKNEGDLTRMQGFTIGFLSHNKEREIYQKDIEAKFSISRATASNMLSIMERKGLIYREAVEHDARLKKLVLSEEAEQMCRQVEMDIEETERLLTKGMTEDDKLRLNQYLDLMIQNMVEDIGDTTTICCDNEKNSIGKN